MDNAVFKSDFAIVDGERLEELGVLVRHRQRKVRPTLFLGKSIPRFRRSKDKDWAALIALIED
jgi:hypothetical protein